MPDPFRLAGPLLRRLDPETAHGIALRALELGLAGRARRRERPSLALRRFGLDFPNPLGLAAGFDKDARAPGRALELGFGFVEVGTVTPLPQAGNPRPRMFRLPEEGAAINRLGFNNAGAERMARRLARRRPAGVLGVNIGMNATAGDAPADYRAAFARLATLTDYVTVNVSSPNTPGLRDLQAPDNLRPVLGALAREREVLALGGGPPLILKLSPDMADGDAVLAATLAADEGFDGLAISNTTVERPDALAGAARREVGGLSGRPLFRRSTGMLRAVFRAQGGRLPLIGVGGVDSAGAAYEKIKAGASLVQFYTALIYRGPRLVTAMLDGLERRLAEDGFESVEQAVGVEA